MAVLVQIKDACKSYGQQVLLDQAEVFLNEDTKVGFVGRNGSGKSTLLRIMLGQEELDRGEIIRHPKLKLGHLRQDDPFLPGETALQFLQRGSGQPNWKCGEVAGQFELKGERLTGPIAKLAGGWQTRLKLAELLLHEPNLLLLDEPTNFLDLRTQFLLEHFLRNYPQACLMVSHDRAFLAATCSHSLNLSHGKLTLFPGKIDDFLEYQCERREFHRRTNAAVEAKRRHLEDFIARNKARASTASRARSKSKELERLEFVDIDGDEPTAIIRPPLVEPRQGPALRCRGLAIGYGDRRVAEEIDLEIEHRARVAVVGDNGQGKTTFLRTVVGSLEPLAGDVRWGYGCQIGVYAQHVYTSLPELKTVLEYLEYHAAPGTKTQTVLDMAGALLFRGEHVSKPISVLSGGERARLCLGGLLLGQFNVLVLDEPGNHLDVDTVEALAEALLAYQGTVIFTSHDRHFMHRVASSVIEVRDGRVTNYLGNYDAYLYSVSKQVDEGQHNILPHSTKKSAASRFASNAVSANRQQDARKLRKELDAIERKAQLLEQKKLELNQKYLTASDPDEALRLHTEMASVSADIAQAEQRWFQLHEALEGMN